MKLLSSIYIAFMICIISAFSLFAADVNRLPDIDGWQNGEVRITSFDTVSGNRGTWLERDYRTISGVPFHAVWMEGSGDKGWDVSDQTLSAYDGPLGSGATYRTLTIAGNKAAIEHHPVSGYSLAVKIGKLGTLTLESNIANEDEIISAAEIIIKKIN